MRDFNNIETRVVIKYFFPARQGTERNSRHSGRNTSLFPPGWAKDLSAPYIKWGCHWTKCLRQWTGVTLIFSHKILLTFVIFTSLLFLLAALISWLAGFTVCFFYFFEDMLQRKCVLHVQGQVTELFPWPVFINIYTVMQVKQKWL
jgi:hypothetical protein